jgi:hypothetical protein
MNPGMAECGPHLRVDKARIFGKNSLMRFVRRKNRVYAFKIPSCVLTLGRRRRHADANKKKPSWARLRAQVGGVMKTLYRPIQGGLLALALAMAAHDAGATAIAAVRFNGFSLSPFLGSADGVRIGGPGNPITGIDVALGPQIAIVTETETGNAAVTFATPSATATGSFGSASIAGSAIANPDGHALGTLVFQVTFNFTNQTGVDLDFLTIRTDFSAFNPGGPQIAASVDNAVLEFARYDSSQSGRGIGDSHHCDTRINSGSGNPTFPTPPPSVACGVSAPDSSQGEFTFFDVDQNETVSETFSLRLELEVQSVPEPGSLALLGAALIGFAGVGMMWRRSL